jgi:hypothetical protein
MPAQKYTLASLLSFAMIVLSEASFASCRGVNASLPLRPNLVMSSIPPLDPFVADGTLLHTGS